MSEPTGSAYRRAGAAGSAASRVEVRRTEAKAKEAADRRVWRPTLRAGRLLACAVCALVPAVAFQTWWTVPMAAFPLLLLTAGRGEHPARIRAEVGVPDRRCIEGEVVTATVTLAADGPVGWTKQEWLAAGTASGIQLLDLRVAGHEIVLVLAVPRWGRWSLGALDVDVYDTAGLRITSVNVELGDIEAFPVPTPDDTTLTPARYPDRFGEHSAKLPGEGVEFIAVRPYVFGDRQRRINWSATSRRGTLQVNTFEAERAAEAVIIVDALSDQPQPAAPGDPRPRTTLDIAVRGAAGLAEAYLKAHDRIGLVTLSGRVQWLTPDSGSKHLFRIAQTVMDLRRDFTYESGGINRLPTRVLPRGAVVYVFSPLLDGSVVEAVRDLADRGHPLVVIDVLGHEPPLPRNADAADHLGLRLWRLDRRAVRFVLGELGVPVINWTGDEPLDLALAPLARMPLAGRTR